MHHPIRLIAMDMDGTLLTRIDPLTACIPPENASVLHRCAADGIHLVLASGRMPDDASFYASDTHLPAHIIGLNGSILLDSPLGTPIFSHTLPADVSGRILDMLIRSGVDVAVFGAWEVASLREQPLTWAQRELGTYFGRTGGRLSYSCGTASVSHLLAHAGKIVALTENDRDGLAAVKAQIASEFPEVSISSSWWNNFEVNPSGVDKGTALTALAAHLGIPMTQVMAIGDNDNDAPMLRAAGVGVAMGNASQAALDAADLITLPNHLHGVASAIRSVVYREQIEGLMHR